MSHLITPNQTARHTRANASVANNARIGGQVALGSMRNREPSSNGAGSSRFAVWSKHQENEGEVVPFVQEGTKLKKRYDPSETIVERFVLQSAARKLVGGRVGNCLRLRQRRRTDQDDGTVNVWRSADHGSTHYSGLQTCGSVWSCPVCAAKISERRRVQLQTCIDQHHANGGEVLLLTLTNPHTREDDLAAMLKAQQTAIHRIYNTRAAKAFWKRLGCVGTVRAWEVTHGHANGWHPHFHILAFVDSGLDLAQVRQQLFEIWANACRLAKLAEPSAEHGVDVQNGDQASAYVSKGLWSLAHEMTKSHTKRSVKNRTPFDLLRSYAYDEDKQAGALFREYSAAFKGKAQLYFSPGLLKRFDLVETSDEEEAARIQEQAALLGRIELDEWALVLKYDHRADILILGRIGGWEPIRELLDGLLKREKDRKIKRSKDKKAVSNET